MIKVAIDTSLLHDQSRFRGIGFYTKNLIEALRNLRESDFSAVLMEKGKIPYDCDLIHYPFFDFFFLTLPLRKSCKSVVTIHDCIPLVFPKRYPPGIKGKINLELQRFSLKSISRIITDSESSRRDIIKYLNYPAEKIDVVYLAPANKVARIGDKKFLENLISKFNLPNKFVLYVGDVNYNKNLPGLVKACRLASLPLVIVGKQAISKNFEPDNIENQSLVEFNQMTEGKKDVLRVGFVEEKDLAGFYTLASVYCQPSFYEGFGLQILEAMSCGCPVVTSNVSSLPEVAGEAALLVDPYNIEEIAEAIKKIISDRQAVEKLVKLGFEQVKKFSWEKTAKKMILSYKKSLR